ncbi:MAG: NCS2 family permease [Candidatus Symbiodolus clandestinus]
MQPLARRLTTLRKQLDRHFSITQAGSSLSREIMAGFTTFLAMVYSIIIIPDMFSSVGFDRQAVFIASCLVAALGSLAIGLWAKLPLVIGGAISLSAFTAFNLVLDRGMSIPVVLGAIFWMGALFSLITQTGIRQWLFNHLPKGIAQGTGMGIGLFLLFIAASRVGLIVADPGAELPLKLGQLAAFPALMTLGGLAAILGLAQRRVNGSMLIVMVTLSLLGLLWDPEVTFRGWVAWPTLSGSEQGGLLGKLDIWGALSPTVLPSVLALILTAIFDVTGTLQAVAKEADLLDGDSQVVNADRVFMIDSVSSLLAGIVGAPPAAVYIESVAGVAAGGRTGLTATVVGFLFLLMLFLSPLSYLVPNYATAPSLMYVGLLMLGNVTQLDVNDKIEMLSGLVCAVFIMLSCNVVTGITLGFGCLVVGRLVAGESENLNSGTLLIAGLLWLFYLGGWAIA